MIILCEPFFLPKRFVGITLWPFIILRRSVFEGKSSGYRQRTINHERIHLAQQLEMFILGFYIQYLMERIVNGHRCISFELEAYANEWYPDYVKTREHYSFFKYM